jgi:crossover junction endodeoxyribonuclease RusA
MITLTLPYPPSVNTYWRYHYKGVHLNPKGRAYRTLVTAHCYDQLGLTEPLRKRLKVTIHAYPPDARLRDLDNIQKPLLDALEFAQVFLNDAQIDHLTTQRQSVTPPKGHLIVTLEEV